MNIKELKEAAGKATPGPWQIGRLGDQKMSHVVDFGPPPKSPYMVLLEGTPAKPQMGGFTGFSPSGVAHADDGSSEANAAYIALANPSTILSLIARVERLEAAATEAVQAIKYLHEKLSFETSVGNGAFTRLRMALSPEPMKAEPALETPANPIEEVVDGTVSR